MDKRIHLGCFDAGKDDFALMAEVLHSGWLSPGEKVSEFEREFAVAHGCKYGVMVNSGTDALRVAIGALKEARGWQDGDQVILPALTFIATANVVVQNDLEPVFVDIDPRTFNVDPYKIEKSISHFTKAIIPVHLFGQMADMPIIKQAVPHDVAVIEDSCETMGTRRICNWGPETCIDSRTRASMERSVGSFGDIACFSTYACHLVNTGVGGIAITNDDTLYSIMRSLANHGRRSDFSDDRFTFDRLGYSCRPTEFEAVLALEQLRRLPETIKARQHNAAYLDAALRGTEDWLQRQDPIRVNVEHAWMMYPLLITDSGIDRDEVLRHLDTAGIDARPFFPLLDSPVYKRLYPGLAESFPVALNASRNGFYVPCHQQLSGDDLGYIAMTIEKAKEVSFATA